MRFQDKNRGVKRDMRDTKNRERRSRWHSFVKGHMLFFGCFKEKSTNTTQRYEKAIKSLFSFLHSFMHLVSCRFRPLYFLFVIVSVFCDSERGRERNTPFLSFSLKFFTNTTNHHYPSPGAEEKYYFPRRDKLLVFKQEWVGEEGKSRSCTGTFLAKKPALRVSYSFISRTERIPNRKGKCNKRQVTEERQTITVSCSKLCCNFLQVQFSTLLHPFEWT